MLHNRKSRRRFKAISRKKQASSGAKAVALTKRSLAGAAGLGAAISLCGPALGQTVLPLVEPGPCTMSGASATCSGDLSEGILANAPGIEELTITSLSGDIAPDAGVSGVSFVNEEVYPDRIVITVTGDGNRIVTNGASGIYARNGYEDRYNDGSIAVHSQIDIVAQGDGAMGIEARGDRNIILRSTGNITTSGEGAHGLAAIHSVPGYHSDPVVEVTSVGDITTTGTDSLGILVTEGTGYGETSVHSTGNIESAGGGISAYSAAGIEVTSIGDITTRDEGTIGIEAGAMYFETIIDSTGDITAGAAGIVANRRYSDVIITSVGNITTRDEGSAGISMSPVDFADISIDSTGDITAGGFGIEASGQSSDVTITSVGDITTRDEGSAGISARIIGRGEIGIDSTGNITAGEAGIVASGDFSDISITSVGDITTRDAGSIGIYAGGSFGATTVHSTGDIESGWVGISAGDYNTSANITSLGDITTSDEGSVAIRGNAQQVGGVEILSTGNLESGATGILGLAYKGVVNITSVGDILTRDAGSVGIRANSTAFYGTGISVDSSGDIESGFAGIAALVNGPLEITSTGNITTRDDGSTGISLSSFYGQFHELIEHDMFIQSAGDITSGLAGYIGRR